MVVVMLLVLLLVLVADAVAAPAIVAGASGGVDVFFQLPRAKLSGKPSLVSFTKLTLMLT